MRNKYLYSVLPFLKKCKRETQQQFEDYFQTAPAWLMECFQVEEMEKGQILCGKTHRLIPFIL